MRKQKFKELRGLLVVNGDNQKALPTIVGKSQSYCDERMSGRKDWQLSDCYKVLDYYEQEHSKLNELFPKGGITT